MAELRACATSALENATPYRVDVDGRPVCLVSLDGTVHAVGDTCTHQDVSLSEGEVDADECTIECWKHGSQFSLTDGAPLSLPAIKPVPVYTVRIEGDDVLVDLGDT